MILHGAETTTQVIAETSKTTSGPRGNNKQQSQYKVFDLEDLTTEQLKLCPDSWMPAFLLAWLLTLQRIQEHEQLLFDWAVLGEGSDIPAVADTHRLNASELQIDLQGTLSKALSAVDRHIRETSRIGTAEWPGQASLYLSNASTTQEHVADALDFRLCLDSGWLKVHRVAAATNLWRLYELRAINALVDVARACILTPDRPVGELTRPIDCDLADIWAINENLPARHSFCMHEVVAKRAQESPTKTAVLAYDGSLTYEQVDGHSTILARRLCLKGVGANDVLGVCFEKSRWTVVAVLAVMKAGGTFVLMDPTLPLARLQNMAQQVGTRVLVASHQQENLARSAIPDADVVIVDADSFATAFKDDEVFILPKVSPETLLYIIFTSGSTGTPKGVKISHATYTSSAIPRANSVGYTAESRVLDFASYAFDVSIDSMLLTLGNGGCLCIPSDEERVNDINGAMRRMRVTYAGLTPSVARILDKDIISSLSALGLGGEAVSSSDVDVWGKQTRIVIGYGPCECTIGCTINSSAASGRDYVSIGGGNGATIWLADPSDHNHLVPVGAVGELLVEGPIVGEGYLNDLPKTEAAFIEDPPWLLAGYKQYKGRKGRLYKTGDLARYDPESPGEFVFVGRKDTQVKLRGQRVELGEIEGQLRTRLPTDALVIAEVVKPSRPGGQPTLVAFLATQSSTGLSATDLEMTDFDPNFRETLKHADAELSKVLPRYMIPTSYLPILRMPVLISGKTDRKSLRQFGSTVDLQKLASLGSGSVAELFTEAEAELRKAWGECLSLEPETMTKGSNFFALGGDSLAAMRLVTASRRHNLRLAVADIFANPTITKMASVVTLYDGDQTPRGSPFSLLEGNVDFIRVEASLMCDATPETVLDIYPCTPTQASLFTFSFKSEAPYVAQRVATIPDNISIETWKEAWERVVQNVPSQRTRLVQLQDGELLQVELEQHIAWRQASDLKGYLEQDRSERMDFGQPLARYAIITSPDREQRYMVWTIHHVVYDGWSEPLILGLLDKALKGETLPPRIGMKDFVQFLHGGSRSTSHGFWRKELQDAIGPQFPPLPARDFMPIPDTTLERHISITWSDPRSYTLATVIRAAWALVVSQHTESDDVVFGETFTGRDIVMDDVETVIGPVNATVPVRIRVNNSTTVESYLQYVQESITRRAKHQHIGWQSIRKVSEHAQRACETGTGLIIQPEASKAGEHLGFETLDVVREALHFNPFPLMLAFGIEKNGFRVCANFDSSIIKSTEMTRILGQLERTCQELLHSVTRKVREVPTISVEELAQVWDWNLAGPLSYDASTQSLSVGDDLQPGAQYPRAMVPWVCSLHTPEVLQPLGCTGELWLESSITLNGIGSTPSWVSMRIAKHARRPGKLFPTGDLVKLAEDGTIHFVRRKSGKNVLNGRTIDLAGLKATLTECLPQGYQGAVILSNSPKATSDLCHEQFIAVVVEQAASNDANLERLMTSDYAVVCDTRENNHVSIKVLAKIARPLANALKDFHSIIENTSPPYMLPSLYITVDQLPRLMGKVNEPLLHQVVASTPDHILAQLKHGLTVVWELNTAQAQRTSQETTLREAWSHVLRLPVEKIGLTDNFFRLGGDSVLAMKLASYLRVQGHALTVAQIFRHMQLKDAATVLKLDTASTSAPEGYRAFSTINQSGDPVLLSEIRSHLADSSWVIQDVCPVTYSQGVDVKATVDAPRTSLQFVTLLFQDDVDTHRLIHACSELLGAHDILRTVFVQVNGQLFQTILSSLELPLELEKTNRSISTYVASWCKQQVEKEHPLGAPFMRFSLVESTSGGVCLIMQLSHAQYDGLSLPRLLRDLGSLYRSVGIGNVQGFPSYIGHTQDQLVRAQAIQYWTRLLTGSELSNFQDYQKTDQGPATFLTKATNITELPEGITVATLLTVGWALTLARSLKQSDVTFCNISSGRYINDMSMEDIVGPCYQFTPVRVVFRPRRTAMETLVEIQKQCAESAPHAFLGFEEISRACTQWKAPSSDSVVHHQDWEEIDTMSFGEGSCKVDLLSPHGDAVYPIKAISFERESRIHVGIVGDEHHSDAIDARLQQLALTLEEIVREPSKPLAL